ncbi:methionine adenosyltransferase [Candidatus Daviesbacteria bacterium]|nr:methionine adenosyltransferase [Candidatus Daviesbacteria bacterium]
MDKNFIFTSESVCSGHPDKICDQVSDAILDEVLKVDPKGRVAVETVAAFNKLIIVGEVTAKFKINFKKIAKQQIRRLGYTNLAWNFSDQSAIEVVVHQQSSEIAAGVDEMGAGDQGMMFGFACKDSQNFMPLPISLAHKLAEKIDLVRENHTLDYLRPDGKTQVTVEYKNGKPLKVLKVVVAVPHNEEISLNQVKESIYKQVVKAVLEEFGFKISPKNLIVNGTGVWHKGGPASDSGLTGRKIVVDTYGGFARVGGGAFSGKDPTKVDRSGAYAARFIAKNIVANNLADKVEVALAYFIGAKKPLMEEIETFGTAKTSQKVIKAFVKKIIDTSVAGIIKTLDLQRPIYLKTASYGHFGRADFPWEKIVKV